MPNHDSATKLSIDYLKTLENRLQITWTDDGEPLFIHNRVKTNALKLLKSDLDDLFTGSPKDEAIQDSMNYGKNNIQTVGFGLVDDLLCPLFRSVFSAPGL